MSKPQNGKKCKKSFKQVYDNYCHLHLPTITESSRIMKLRHLNKFTIPLEDLQIQEITSEIMSEFMVFTKEYYPKYNPGLRYKFNYDKQLKALRSIFNFYIEHQDPSYYNPVRKSHFKMGVLSPPPIKNRRISREDILKFQDALPPNYRSIFTTQVSIAGRISEVVGIHRKNIDFENRTLLIKEVLVFPNGKPKIKQLPKNNLTRTAYINDVMLDIFKKQIGLNKNIDSPLLFLNKRGKPYTYNSLQEAYNRAWKKIGLYPKYSGTHLARYIGASYARKLCGSLDFAMALSGHVDVSLGHSYSKHANDDLNKEAPIKVHDHLFG